MTETRNENNKTVTVLGIGKAGTKIAEILSTFPEAEWIKVAAADTDSSVIEASTLKNMFPVGIEWTHGMGCGGEVIKGERAFAHFSKKQIETFFEGSSLLIIVGGLGGGTATGGASVLARIAKKMKIPAVFIVTTPFSFEGHSKRMISEHGIKALVQDADVVLPIPNDILYSTLKSDTPADDAFKKANSEIARAIVGVAEIIRGKNLLSADFSDLKSALNKRKSFCGIGLGSASSADGPNRCITACERLLESPLLGGVDKIRNADVLFITVCGGQDMNIGEMKQALEVIHRHCTEKTKMIVGASNDPAYGDLMQITLLAIYYDLTVEKQSAGTFGPNMPKEYPLEIVGSDKPPVQGDLPLMQVSKGIFTNTSKNIISGQDLDIPTFQRMGIHIDKGK